jgi:hypothetical protein
MFLAMDDVLESGRRAVEDLVEYVKEILAEYLEDSVIKPRDLHNKLSSESSAARAGDWPTAGGVRKGPPSIDAGTSIADRLKRAAQPNSDASEEDGCFESWKLGLTVDGWG